MNACFACFYFFCSFFLFPGGWGSHQPSGSRISWEGPSERKSKIRVPFLCVDKIIGQIGPLPCSIFPESPGQIFEIVILISIVKKVNKYVSEDDLIPDSLLGKGGKLWTLPFVYFLILVIGKYTVVFRGINSVGRRGGSGVTQEDPSMKFFFMGGDNFHERGAWFVIII